uniref:Uncharacterized protein n=1 Tax=Arundo donax TaxID=35708 RepID=A0A0A9H6C2_ARUDO
MRTPPRDSSSTPPLSGAATSRTSSPATRSSHATLPAAARTTRAGCLMKCRRGMWSRGTPWSRHS